MEQTRQMPPPRHYHPQEAPSPGGLPTPQARPPHPAAATRAAPPHGTADRWAMVSAAADRRGWATCTDLPRIPTEIHLFVLKQEEKEGQAGPGTQCQQLAHVPEPRGGWHGPALCYSLRPWVWLLMGPALTFPSHADKDVRQGMGHGASARKAEGTGVD